MSCTDMKAVIFRAKLYRIMTYERHKNYPNKKELSLNNQKSLPIFHQI